MKKRAKTKAAYTEQYKKARVLDILAGETVAAMSKRTGITKATLYRWKQTYGDEQMAEGKKQIKQSLKDEKKPDAEKKAVVSYLTHALKDMQLRRVERTKYKALVELALLTLTGE